MHHVFKKIVKCLLPNIFGFRSSTFAFRVFKPDFYASALIGVIFVVGRTQWELTGWRIEEGCPIIRSRTGKECKLRTWVWRIRWNDCLFYSSKTPGGKLVYLYPKKPAKVPICGQCHRKLRGIIALRPLKLMSVSKRHKTVTRSYGGHLCGQCLRERYKTCLKDIVDIVFAELFVHSW